MYHIPVMLRECLDGLNIAPQGTYVDLTFGGGGHSKVILEQLDGGRLIAFDQDEDAAKQASQIDHRSFTFIGANFGYVKRYLKSLGILQVDGVLADLGVSSHQIDEPSRGFSTRFNGRLDMRMDRSAGLTAEEVINTYSAAELHKIFGMYGEVRNAKTLAQAIVSARVQKPIVYVEELRDLLARYAKKGSEFRYYAQVFQALRIEVNQELKVLEDMLSQMADVIRPGGRLVIMSYHSLEDRLVKNYIAKGNVMGKTNQDFYGNLIRPFKAVNRKPITVSEDEIKENKRARSAKLRIAERITDGGQ